MPHATNEMSQPLVNGEKRSSKFLDHVSSYPVVSDGIETFKSNPYGKKSLELADSAYSRVEPYLETPKQYVAPYAKKADELADSGLNHVETRFPIVKEDTNTIVDKGKGLALWPLQLAGQSKDYVVTTYNDEYTKTAKHNGRGAGFSTFVLALISTELRVASDFFQAIADFLGPKYEESKQKGADLVQQAQETAEQYKQIGQDKLNEFQNKAPNNTEQAKQQAYQGKEDAKQQAQQGKEEVKQQAGEAQKKMQQK